MPNGSERPSVSVVIPARDGVATLGRALAALARQDLDAAFETIVVDNGSLDGTHLVAERAELPVRLIRLPRGGGPGGARNAGAAVARADVIAFTDADCFAAPQWLRESLVALAGADLVQGRVEADPEAPLGPFDHTVWVTHLSPLFETANMVIRKELFERLGGFEDWLQANSGRPFGEDVWLGWRARRDGGRVAFAERALVHHAVVARGPGAYVAERARLRWFPPLVRKVPELRREFLRARVFLTPRSARFDLALAGAIAAALARRAVPLVAALPYMLEIARIARPHGRGGTVVAPVEIAADAVGLAALLAGGARWRSPVL